MKVRWTEIARVTRMTAQRPRNENRREAERLEMIRREARKKIVVEKAAVLPPCHVGLLLFLKKNAKPPSPQGSRILVVSFLKLQYISILLLTYTVNEF